MSLSLSNYSKIKGIPIEALEDFELYESKYRGEASIAIPYFDANGENTAIRFRNALKGKERFRWGKNTELSLYGLNRLEKAEKAGFVIIVEGGKRLPHPLVQRNGSITGLLIFLGKS